MRIKIENKTARVASSKNLKKYLLYINQNGFFYFLEHYKLYEMATENGKYE